MELTVREAVPSDIEAMKRLAEQSESAAHWRDQDYARIFEPDAPARLAFIVELSDRISGFMVTNRAGQEWEIENIVVARDKRRLGLADRLMAELLDRARTAGVLTIFLEVRESNGAARALYRKWGFADIAKRKEYYSAPVEDGVVYSRHL